MRKMDWHPLEKSMKSHYHPNSKAEESGAPYRTRSIGEIEADVETRVLTHRLSSDSNSYSCSMIGICSSTKKSVIDWDARDGLKSHR
jgi:hypothetical protein